MKSNRWEETRQIISEIDPYQMMNTELIIPLGEQIPDSIRIGRGVHRGIMRTINWSKQLDMVDGSDLLLEWYANYNLSSSYAIICHVQADKKITDLRAALKEITVIIIKI